MQDCRNSMELKYADSNELLPSRLGAPEVTMLDLFTQRERAKEAKIIQTFKQWVVCFNILVKPACSVNTSESLSLFRSKCKDKLKNLR